MRAFSTTVVASALGVERRWLDTVIAQNRIDGVRAEGQGVSRAISPAAVLLLAVSLKLIETFELPIARALELAQSLVRNAGAYSPAPDVMVHIDLRVIEQRIAVRLAEAVAAHPPARRGRPPNR